MSNNIKPTKEYLNLFNNCSIKAGDIERFTTSQRKIGMMTPMRPNLMTPNLRSTGWVTTKQVDTANATNTDSFVARSPRQIPYAKDTRVSVHLGCNVLLGLYEI